MRMLRLRTNDEDCDADPRGQPAAPPPLCRCPDKKFTRRQIREQQRVC